MDPIAATDIARRHPNGRGVEGVSLTVQTGRCLGVLGPNGSGKTTLTRLIAGLDRIEQGTLSVLGGPACPRPSRLRRRCGVALDAPAHWETLSGRQNLWFFARQSGLRGDGLRQRVSELLALADLGAQADEPVSAYSFGMRRKLSIIEALAHDPDLLVLDEPSAGADTAFLQQLVQWIAERCARGKTTWIADNDADWVSRAATDAILLCDGQLAAAGIVTELMTSLAAQSRIDIRLEKPDQYATPDIEGVKTFTCEGDRIRAEVQSNPQLPAEMLRWITSQGGRVRSLEVHSMTLYEALIQRAAAEGADP
jgi:ABC-type multidrug transport system ATPase subunit